MSNKKTDLNDRQFDELFDKLISAKPIVCKNDFADSVIESINEGKTADSPLFDRLIKSMPIRLGKSFDERVLSVCRQIGKKTERKILPMVAYLSAAACAMFAVVGISGTQIVKSANPLSVRDDYAKLTQISEEITDISVLLVQEEFFDVLQQGRLR